MLSSYGLWSSKTGNCLWERLKTLIKSNAGLKNCRRRGGFFVKKCSFIIHFRREQFIKCVKMDNLVCVEDFEKAALKIWDENAAGYYTR